MQNRSLSPVPPLLIVLGPLLGTSACVHDLDGDCATVHAGCADAAGTDASTRDEGARALTGALAPLAFLSVSEGGRYPDGFPLQVRAPAGTAYAVYSGDARVLAVADDPTSAFGARVTFGSYGAKGIVARAFDPQHAQIAEGAVAVWVDARSDTPSVEFLSPASEGGSYTNGIWFKAAVRGDVWHVRYSADGWVLGESTDPSTDYGVRYTFSLVGERRVRVEALSLGGAVLASAERRIIVVDPAAPTPSTRAGRASALLAEHSANRVVFWEQQFGGRADGADALANVQDTAQDDAALRSVHGNAPGGSVYLSTALLDGLLGLEARGHRFFVTSIAGGSHSPGSLHYQGRAFDVDEIDGVRIYGDSDRVRAFMDACWQLSAIEVFGPSNDPAGHFDHVHCAW